MPGSLTLLDFSARPHEGWDSVSPFVSLVARALRFTRLAFTQKPIPLLKLPIGTPHGQLPVLRIGDEVVADSTRILERIERELAPGALTQGLDARTRAEAWLWEEFADTSLYPYGLLSRWADDRHWPTYRPALFADVPLLLRGPLAWIVRRGILGSLKGRDFTRAGLDASYVRMGRVLDALDARAPSSGFWLSDMVTVADLGLFAQLHTLRSPYTPAVAHEVQQRHQLNAYLDRVNAATLR